MATLKGHFAILSTFIKLPFVIFVLSIFEWPFYTGFTVCPVYSESSLSEGAGGGGGGGLGCHFVCSKSSVRWQIFFHFVGFLVLQFK